MTAPSVKTADHEVGMYKSNVLAVIKVSGTQLNELIKYYYLLHTSLFYSPTFFD